MQTPTFETIQRQSVTEQAIRQIRDLVTSGKLMPGHKLPPERSLSEMLGVSRPSLREAIRALTAMGVLEIRQGSGTYVSSLSAELLTHPLSLVLASNGKSLQGLFEIRLILEVAAARWAASAISDEDLNRLAELDRQSHEHIHDLERFIEDDIAFHHTIHEASANPVLSALMESLSILGKGSRMVTAQRLQVRERTCREHRQIYAALREHDPAASAAAMAGHLEHVRAALPDGELARGG